ncbi:MAG: protein kinase domain-containing protein, partial [Oceanicaulis sp.]
MRSLVMKFTLLCGVMLISAIALLMAIEFQLKRTENTGAGLTHAQLITELFAGNSASAIADQDARALVRLLGDFAARDDVDSIYVADVNRRVLAVNGATGYAPGERATGQLIQSALGAVDTRIETLGPVIRVAEPAFEKGRLVGAVVVTVPIAAVARPAGEILRRQILIAAATLLVFLPLVAWMVRQSLGPIRKLTEAARLASSRKLDLRIEVNTGDELEVLANAFNRMFARLEASMKRVHRLAYVDMITELPNRERFRKEVERTVREAGETGHDGAILFLDLDRFKRVNDSLGIGEGDRGYTVLRRVPVLYQAAVYKAVQVSLDRPVALKVLPSEFTNDADFVERFFNEARAAAALSHPNIVQAYDAGITEDDICYFAMEFVEGESLQERVEREGALKPAMALQAMKDVALALEYGWKRQRLTHGDIKPANIMVNERGIPKLSDFGLAKVAEFEFEGDGIMLTPLYAAPELIQGIGSGGNSASDIYSYGATLYHL